MPPGRRHLNFQDDIFRGGESNGIVFWICDDDVDDDDEPVVSVLFLSAPSKLKSYGEKF
jgi:hypothetical protein